VVAKFKPYCPHLDGNVFEWILKEVERMKKTLPPPRNPVVKPERRKL
jgi:hypothetical protein